MLCAVAATAAFAQAVPRPAADLTIEMPGGKNLALRSLRGKVVGLAFISTT